MPKRFFVKGLYDHINMLDNPLLFIGLCITGTRKYHWAIRFLLFGILFVYNISSSWVKFSVFSIYGRGKSAVHSACVFVSRRYAYLNGLVSTGSNSGYVRVRKKTEGSFDFGDDEFVSDGLPQQRMSRDENIADKIFR